MAALLSPLQLQAASGLFQNKGYQVNPGVTAAVDAYQTVIGVGTPDDIANAIPLLANLIAAMDEAITANTLPANTQILLQSFANSCPALADSFNSTLTYPVTSTGSNPGLTGIITLTADAYMGNGDLSKFVQTFTQANSYCSTTNIFIESAVNSNNYLGPTFTGMDNLVTAGLTEINRATEAMGIDLYNAGQYIDLGNLDNYGSPLALVQQISRRAGTISPLIVPLSIAGVPENVILGLNDPAVIITDTVQKLMYQALLNVTDDELANILRILDVWTPNINNLADLLNPAVMFPNSYPSLITPTADGPRAVYITPEPQPPIDFDNISPEENQALLDKEAATATVDRPLACEIRQSENPVLPESGNTGSGAFYTPNSELEATAEACQTGISYARLSTMTNSGLALVNKSLACSLGQVTNIGRMTLPQLSEAFLAVETNKDLPAIEDQPTPVPQADLDYYASNIAIGSGENGTILLTDVIGTAAGTNISENLGNCVAIIDAMRQANANVFIDLITIYDDIYANTLASDNANVISLISDAGNVIGNIITANPDATANLNTYFSAINTQLTREAELLTRAVIDIGNVQGNNQVAIMSFVSSLPGYGLDTKVGGSAQYLEDVAVISGVGNIIITDPGSSYVNANNVTTTGGSGTGLTLDITQTGGIIDTAVVNCPGKGYVVSDVVAISGGGGTGATVEITSLNTSGQSTVATLREGRTTAGLNAAGVGTAANAVESTPTTPPPQATLLPSKISVREARTQVIY